MAAFSIVVLIVYRLLLFNYIPIKIEQKIRHILCSISFKTYSVLINPHPVADGFGCPKLDDCYCPMLADNRVRRYFSGHDKVL